MDGTPEWPGNRPRRTDAELHADIRAAWARMGPALFEHATGEFALAIIDHRAGRVLLGVDRMGVRSLAYASTADGGLVFGTSVDEVARHRSVAAPLSAQALFDYMHFHMVPSPGTAYDGVAKLRPAERLEFADGTCRLQRYWLPRFASRTDAPVAALREELRGVLRRAVRRSLTAHPQIAAFLSGGLDSSTVAGLMAEESRGEFTRTFSAGFEAEGYDELRYARIVSDHFKLRSTEVQVTPDDIVAAVPLLARLCPEPFGNSSIVPTWICARTARENGVAHLLAGDGGDELFGGNRHYSRQRVFELYRHVPERLRGASVEEWLLRTLSPDGVLPLRKLRSYVEQARIPLPRRLHSWDFMFRTPVDDVFTPELLARVDAGHPDELMEPVYLEPETREYLDRLLYFDWQFVLADSDLRKVNTGCELAGVSVSYPMLDTEVVDFSLRLPASFKVNGQALRPFYKRAMRGFLPDAVIRKQKHGFGLPFGLWLKTSAPLRQLVTDSLAGLRQRGLFQPRFLDDLVARHRVGHASYFGYAIWDLVMLEQWLQAHSQSLWEPQAAPLRV